jgi:hypothetical protein
MIVFGSVYVVSIPAAVAISATFGSKEPAAHAGVMAIPLAGPWLEIAGVVEEESAEGTPGFIAVGVLQIAGVAMTIVGLTVKREVPAAAALPQIDVGPMGSDGWGVRAGGAF